MRRTLRIVISVILLLTLSLLPQYVFSDVYASQFNVKDTYNDSLYHLNQTNDKVVIRGSHIENELNLNHRILDAVCFNDNFTLLCLLESESSGLKYIVYFYNLKTSHLNKMILDCPADRGYPSFTSDMNLRLFITDSSDRKVMHIYTNNDSSSVIFPDNIIQLLCLDGENVLVFTPSETFIFRNNSYSSIPDLDISPPCKYIADRILSDKKDNKFFFEGGTLKNTSSTDTAETQPENTERIVIKDGYIYLKENMTYNSLCKYFNVEKKDFIIYKQDLSPLTSGKTGTGMSAVYNLDKYTILVMGDLTGEGNINSRDLKALMEHLTGESPLTQVASKAADLNLDGVINTKDLLELSRKY